MTDWQPIDTAPKDGGKVLLARFDWVLADITDFDSREWKFLWCVSGQWNGTRWTDGLEALVPPTHFMPLPEREPQPTEGPLGCKVPPAGWYCTRKAGHTGPCAAIEVGRKLAEEAMADHVQRPSASLPFAVKMAGAEAITEDHMTKRANYDAACDCWDAMVRALVKDTA